MCRVFGRGQCVVYCVTIGVCCHVHTALVEGSVSGLLCDIGVCCHVQGVWYSAVRHTILCDTGVCYHVHPAHDRQTPVSRNKRDTGALLTCVPYT